MTERNRFIDSFLKNERISFQLSQKFYSNKYTHACRGENTISMSRFSMFREFILAWVHIMVLTEYAEWEDQGVFHFTFVFGPRQRSHWSNVGLKTCRREIQRSMRDFPFRKTGGTDAIYAADRKIEAHSFLPSFRPIRLVWLDYAIYGDPLDLIVPGFMVHALFFKPIYMSA